MSQDCRHCDFRAYAAALRVLGCKPLPKISEIAGIDPDWEQKLQAIGIDTVDELLRAGASSSGRENLAIQTGVSELRVTTLVKRAGLYQIRGMTKAYVELLEHAGVSTADDLAMQFAENLHKRMILANWQRKIVSVAPDIETVREWLVAANALLRIGR
jgi:predicted RecB family nuclease